MFLRLKQMHIEWTIWHWTPIQRNDKCAPHGFRTTYYKKKSLYRNAGMKTRICEHKMDTPCDFNIDSHNCKSYWLDSWQVERETVDHRTWEVVRFNQSVSEACKLFVTLSLKFFTASLFLFSSKTFKKPGQTCGFNIFSKCFRNFSTSKTKRKLLSFFIPQHMCRTFHKAKCWK